MLTPGLYRVYIRGSCVLQQTVVASDFKSLVNLLKSGGYCTTGANNVYYEICLTLVSFSHTMQVNALIVIVGAILAATSAADPLSEVCLFNLNEDALNQCIENQVKAILADEPGTCQLQIWLIPQSAL